MPLPPCCRLILYTFRCFLWASDQSCFSRSSDADNALPPPGSIAKTRKPVSQRLRKRGHWEIPEVEIRDDKPLIDQCPKCCNLARTSVGCRTLVPKPCGRTQIPLQVYSGIIIESRRFVHSDPTCYLGLVVACCWSNRIASDKTSPAPVVQRRQCPPGLPVPK